jgi:hypothetical protein
MSTQIFAALHKARSPIDYPRRVLFTRRSLPAMPGALPRRAERRSLAPPLQPIQRDNRKCWGVRLDGNIESDLDRLAALAKELSDTKSLEAAFETVLQAVQSLGFARCRLYLLQDETKELVGLDSTGDKAFKERFKGLHLDVTRNPYLANAIEQTAPRVLQPAPDTDPDFAMLGKSQIEWMDVPLRHDNELYGMMAVDNDTSGRPFTKRDLQVMSIIAEMLSGRWARARPLSFAEHLRILKKSMVLILGKDTEAELQILRNISAIVSSLGYESHLVKDAPEIPEMSNEEKVHSYAGASRFVLLENSFAAGQIAEMKIMATNRIVTAILRQRGRDLHGWSLITIWTSTS